MDLQNFPIDHFPDNEGYRVFRQDFLDDDPVLETVI